MVNEFGGQWTSEKLGILGRYLDAYTTALKRQKFQLIYVDAFAGTGKWKFPIAYHHDDYGDFVKVRDGSARIALGVSDKAFDSLVFIEKDGARCEALNGLKSEFPNRRIEIVNDDANNALASFCQSLASYDRAVVFLDPYATQVSWETVEMLACTQKMDCWILFPLSAVARQMPINNEPTDELALNLDRIFGGRKHWHGIYQSTQQMSLFGDEVAIKRPQGGELIADLYRNRLGKVFVKVAPTRRVFRNSKNSPMFDLFFAASNPKGAPIAVEIADHILKHW